MCGKVIWDSGPVIKSFSKDKTAYDWNPSAELYVELNPASDQTYKSWEWLPPARDGCPQPEGDSWHLCWAPKLQAHAVGVPTGVTYTTWLV